METTTSQQHVASDLAPFPVVKTKQRLPRYGAIDMSTVDGSGAGSRAASRAASRSRAPSVSRYDYSLVSARAVFRPPNAFCKILGRYFMIIIISHDFLRFARKKQKIFFKRFFESRNHGCEQCECDWGVLFLRCSANVESPFKRASNFPRSRAATPVGGGDTPVPASSRSPSRSRTPVPSYSEVRTEVTPPSGIKLSDLFVIIHNICTTSSQNYPKHHLQLFPVLNILLVQALCRVSKRLRQRSLPPPPPPPKHEFSLPRPSAYTSVGMQAPAPRVVASDYYKKYIKSIYEREPMFKVSSHRITPLSHFFRA